MTKHDLQIFELQAHISKTLGDPTRLRIIHELRSGEMSVGQLVANLELPQSNVSRHLSVLRDRAIVLTRREGTTIYYWLASIQIAQACDLVREMLENRLAHSQVLSSSLSSLSKDAKKTPVAK